MLVNLTPHAITIIASSYAKKLVIQPSGKVARVVNENGKTSSMKFGDDEIDVREYTEFSRIEGLPEPNGVDCFIVSSIVLSHCNGRKDVFGPGTFPSDNPMRDESGNIVAVRCLISAPK